MGGKAVRENLAALGSTYAKLDALFRSAEFRRWVGRVSDIEDLLFDPDYVGGGTHENIDRQELDAHVDFNFHPKTRLHRRLNLILFVNREWGEDWGGQLQLHRDPWLPPAEDEVRSVVPIGNRCVLFETTETSWHGFPAIRIPEDKKGATRRSVAVYFYTRTRPAELTGPEHSTYYVPRPLPEQIRPGRTLTEEDYQQIRHLLDRRDRQVRFLWEKEREFRGFLAQVEHSAAFRLSRAMTWPLRAVRDLLRGQD
ncbi:MAG: 2OG-Fe(II) oxygenase [Bryobacterales bacterium]